MLKPIRIILFSCLAIFGLQAIAQQNISEGVIEYKEVIDLGGIPTKQTISYDDMTFTFSDRMFKMHRSNYTSKTTYKPSGSPEKGHIFVYTEFGIGLTGLFSDPLEEDYAESMFGVDIGKFKAISYDKRDTKTILGYHCYRANLVLADGSKQVYYITDKIKAPGFRHKGQSTNIEGYPLEIHYELELVKGEIFNRVFRAVKISPGLPAGCFNLPTGKSDKGPMHKKNTVSDKLPEINVVPPFVFKSKVLKELFGIAWQLNESNMHAVMLAEAYKLKPNPDNNLVSTYEHDKKRPVYLVTDNSDTAYVHILKCMSIYQEVESILEDFKANDIVMVNEQKDKTTTSYYFVKKDYPYMFRYQTGSIASTFMYVYKMVEKK